MTDLRRRLELHGFGLLETIDPEATGRRFLIYEPGQGFVIRGHDQPLTAAEVEAFVIDLEDHWLSADPPDFPVNSPAILRRLYGRIRHIIEDKRTKWVLGAAPRELVNLSVCSSAVLRRTRIPRLTVGRMDRKSMTYTRLWQATMRKTETFSGVPPATRLVAFLYPVRVWAEIFPVMFFSSVRAI